MLDEHTILKYRDLRAITGLADDHLAVDCLPAGKELGFSEDWGPAAPGITALATPLLLRLKTG